MAGRSHGKLLPRYAGPIAEFVLTHPEGQLGRAVVRFCGPEMRLEQLRAFSVLSQVRAPVHR